MSRSARTIEGVATTLHAQRLQHHAASVETKALPPNPEQRGNCVDELFRAIGDREAFIFFDKLITDDSKSLVQKVFLHQAVVSGWWLVKTTCCRKSVNRMMRFSDFLH